jgi:cysteine sulfinate desulfinase/cysteine desulfurase-like protein
VQSIMSCSILIRYNLLENRTGCASISIDFLVASAHKFHGPKGVGFAFIRKIQVYSLFLVVNRKRIKSRN